jgi:hypothetical protein
VISSGISRKPRNVTWRGTYTWNRIDPSATTVTTYAIARRLLLTLIGDEDLVGRIGHQRMWPECVRADRLQAPEAGDQQKEDADGRMLKHGDASRRESGVVA